MEWYLKCLKHYFDFSGRARRKEYWMFVFCNFIFMLALVLIDDAIGLSQGDGLGMLGGIYALAVLIPGLAVTVRRLHDIGKSGWNLFLAIIPIVGPILLLVWYCTEGEHCDNAYGPDPKASEV